MTLTRRLILLIALGIVPLALSNRVPALANATLFYNVLLVAAALADYFLCPRPSDALVATRSLDDVLSVTVENPVSVRVENRFERALTAILRDEPPGHAQIVGSRQARTKIPAGQSARFDYAVVPPTRGDWEFGPIFARIVGPLGLIERQGVIGDGARVPVYPNLRAIDDYDLQLRRVQRLRAGARRARTPGVGREFAALRDYTPDDEYRSIDWKATARRGKVTARTYEAERTQDILLLIDEGRLMRQEIDHAQKLDHVVNAALMLAHVVARADDRIGLLTFADTPRNFLIPHRGRAQASAILNALYAARAEPVESDYRGAFRELARQWRKRSLAVLFTDLSDPDSGAMLLDEILRLAKVHVVVCVVVRDPLLSERTQNKIESIDDVYERAVAREARNERERALDNLRDRGVFVVDSEPQDLSADLIARYLQVKHAALI